MAKAKLIEKIGYGFGDMSSSTFWKVFSYYLPIFYSNIFGLSLIDAGVLVLVTRIWDAVSDPMTVPTLNGESTDLISCGWRRCSPFVVSCCLPRPTGIMVPNLYGPMSPIL